MRLIATRLAVPLISWGLSASGISQERQPARTPPPSPAVPTKDPIVQLHEAISGKVAQTQIHLYQKAALSVATVERRTEEGIEVGCGFFIDDQGTFVTVLANSADTLEMKVRYGGREFSPQLLAMDPYTRLAVMVLDGVKPPGLDVVPSRSVEIGDFLIAVAETPDEGGRCTIGRLTGREKVFDGVPLAATMLRLNLKEQPGCFGAPLVNRGGKVAGVVLLGVSSEDGVSYALPSELIEKVRRDHAKHGKVQPCWLGIGLAQGTTTPSIVSLSDDSPAKAAGLQEGDVISRIGERAVREYQDVVDACYYLTAGEAVAFTVMRGLEDLTVSVLPSIRDERKQMFLPGASAASRAADAGGEGGESE